MQQLLCVCGQIVWSIRKQLDHDENDDEGIDYTKTWGGSREEQIHLIWEMGSCAEQRCNRTHNVACFWDISRLCSTFRASSREARLHSRAFYSSFRNHPMLCIRMLQRYHCERSPKVIEKSCSPLPPPPWPWSFFIAKRTAAFSLLSRSSNRYQWESGVIEAKRGGEILC